MQQRVVRVDFKWILGAVGRVASGIVVLVVAGLILSMIMAQKQLDCLNSDSLNTCEDEGLVFLDTLESSRVEASAAVKVVSIPIYGSARMAGLPDAVITNLDNASSMIQVTDSNAACVLGAAKEFARKTATNRELIVVGGSFVELAGNIEGLSRPMTTLLPIYDQYTAAEDALTYGAVTLEVQRLINWAGLTAALCS